MKEKILCEECGYHPAVGEADMGNGVKFYCRKCMIGYADIEDFDVDESLVFCSREWDEQG